VAERRAASTVGLSARWYAFLYYGEDVTRLPVVFDPAVSQRLEQAAARAWPAAEVEEIEGWLLRRTEGVDRRRSNSLLPPVDPGHAARTVELALATAEELGFSPAVQVSPAEGHLRLDDALADRGMPATGPSLVLAGPLAAAGRASAHVELGPLDARWVEAWGAVSGIPGTEETAELVLSQLDGRARYALARDAVSGDPLAVALGVLDGEWLGLFSLATAPAARRRGIGSAVVDALEGWAAAAGAAGTYLQVERDNEPALGFYARRGFHVAHSYHYRSA
jgi:ribosomal protein S18 acetylase RimI-like enzyme